MKRLDFDDIFTQKKKNNNEMKQEKIKSKMMKMSSVINYNLYLFQCFILWHQRFVQMSFCCRLPFFQTVFQNLYNVKPLKSCK